jgi:GNAT superfamily N-acetyltransferase
MAISIRDATPADAAAISALVRQSARNTIFANGPDDGCNYFLAMNTPAATTGRMRGNYHYYIAEDEGQIVGMIAMRDNSHLYHLFVDQAWHGHGIGRRLWEHAREVCRRNGNPGRYTVNSTPEAIPIYERFGFVATGEIETRNGLTALPMRLGPA